jgi:FlaA1/EpsC-like NDP-sugar epimerase
MTRYFMTIPEAAWLILDAAALGTNGDLFVLDMGEPVKIMDLARDLIRLAGRDPDSQPIHVVGLRPGEKLHERLFYEIEAVEPTASAKVLRALAPPPPVDIREAVKELLALADGAREDELREAILGYVRSVDGARPDAGSSAEGHPPDAARGAIGDHVGEWEGVLLHRDRVGAAGAAAVP